jgi:parallel beta-helix repeat protein
MGKNAVAVLVLIFLAASCMAVTAPAVFSADVGSSITIREDGSVEGTDKIQRNGNLYTFTGDISVAAAGFVPAGIQVLKDNIVIDGAHFSIYASDSSWNGIDLTGRSNVEVRNLKIVGFTNGVFLDNSSSNTIDGNEIIGYSGSDPHGVPTGIWLSLSSNNKITSNMVTSNIDYGILVQAASTDNTIEGNIIADNGVGLVLDYCPNNILRNNQMNGNDQNFKLGYNTFSQFTQDIDTSNTLDGKPLYYWLNEHNKTVPSDAGFVALGNCTNITVKDLQISHSFDSITLINTNDSVVANNVVGECGNGIFLKYCQNVNVTGNAVTGNLDSGVGTIACKNIIIAENNVDSCKFGITTAGQTYRHAGGSGSTNMTISKNNITRCTPGIYFSLSRNILISNNYFAYNIKGINLISSSQSTITENTFAENYEGAVRISGAQNNSFFRNNFIGNNASGSQIDNPWIVLGNPEGNTWDNGVEGNYWSDYKQRYPNATEISGSGVWDTPYYINEKNIDHYPLVEPFSADQPSSTPQATPTDTEPSEPTPIEFPTAVTIAAVAASTAIGVGLLLHFKKRKR